MGRKKFSDRDELILECANYCMQYNWSVRKIARNVGISKSTVHRFLTDDLMFLDSQAYSQCRRILEGRRNR